MFKIFTDRHIKTSRSLKRRAILKIPSTVFRRTYALSIGLKMKPLGKSVFQCLEKNQPKFCRKICWKEQPSVFTVYLMNRIFQAFVLIMECIELNWLCEHIKKIRSSQPTFLVLNWLNHQSFPVSIVKTILFPSSLPFLFFFFFSRSPLYYN